MAPISNIPATHSINVVLGDLASGLPQGPGPTGVSLGDFPWGWISILAVLTLIYAWGIYKKRGVHSKVSFYLNDEVGLKDKAQLGKLSDYNVFQYLSGINESRYNLFLDRHKKDSLEALEKTLLEYLTLRMEEEPSITGDIIERIQKDKDAIISDPMMDWLLTLEIKENHTVFDGSPWINAETGEQEIYQGMFYSVIKEVIERLDLGEEEVFYDLGSGYGRVPLYFGLTTRLKKIKGIELVGRRVEQSREAAKRLGLDQVEFIQANARVHDFSDGEIFFMFNPFTGESLRVVVDRLKELSRAKPIRIISFGLCNHYLIEQKDWLREVDRIKWKSKIYGKGVFFFECGPE